MLKRFSKLKANSTPRLVVLTQLVREMWAPLVMAVSWTGFSLYQDPGARNVKDAISNFGTSFFLVCWAFSQWYRVKKQQKVEGGISEIDARINQSISNFNDKVTTLLNNLTGGPGFCYVQAFANPTGPSHLSLISDEKYSLFDLTFSIRDAAADSQKYESFDEYLRQQTNFPVGELAPGRAVTIGQFDFKLGSAPRKNFLINFFARNGIWLQELQFYDTGNGYIFATKVTREFHSVVLFEFAEPGFPRNSVGDIDWVVGRPP